MFEEFEELEEGLGVTDSLQDHDIGEHLGVITDSQAAREALHGDSRYE